MTLLINGLPITTGYTLIKYGTAGVRPTLLINRTVWLLLSHYFGWEYFPTYVECKTEDGNIFLADLGSM